MLCSDIDRPCAVCGGVLVHPHVLCAVVCWYSEDPIMIEEYVVGSGAAIVSASRIVKLLMFMPRAQIASMQRAKAVCCRESSEQGDGSKEGR